MTAVLLTAIALLSTPATSAEPPTPIERTAVLVSDWHPPAPADAVGTWSPDGMVCRPDAAPPVCRYVAPDCQLVRVMDAEPNLSGTRYELWCRPPRNAA